jgi:hypothetical protein
MKHAGLDYSSILKMEATCSSETSLEFQRTTQHYITEDRTLHNCQGKIFKFDKKFLD